MFIFITLIKVLNIQIFLLFDELNVESFEVVKEERQLNLLVWTDLKLSVNVIDLEN